MVVKKTFEDQVETWLKKTIFRNLKNRSNFLYDEDVYEIKFVVFDFPEWEITKKFWPPNRKGAGFITQSYLDSLINQRIGDKVIKKIEGHYPWSWIIIHLENYG